LSRADLKGKYSGMESRGEWNREQSRAKQYQKYYSGWKENIAGTAEWKAEQTECKHSGMEGGNRKKTRTGIRAKKRRNNSLTFSGLHHAATHHLAEAPRFQQIWRTSSMLRYFSSEGASGAKIRIKVKGVNAYEVHLLVAFRDSVCNLRQFGPDAVDQDPYWIPCESKLS
jgi:hypothetical protein